MLRAKIGYETKVIRLILGLLLAMSAVPIIMFFFLPDEERWAMALVAAILSLTAFIFGFSPLLTKHEIHDTHIFLRQGWYYKNMIELADIVSIKRVSKGPWSYGAHYIGGGVVYVNGRTDDLILFELSERNSRNGGKRRANKVLFDTLDNDNFAKTIGRGLDGRMERLCGQDNYLNRPFGNRG
jgi:hypothetical protein